MTRGEHRMRERGTPQRRARALTALMAGALLALGAAAPGAASATARRAAVAQAEGIAGPALAPGRVMDGNAATTERLAHRDATLAAIAISQERFDGDGGARMARHVVLSRDDEFADSLAGAPLTALGPLLLTGTDALRDVTSAEIDRVLEPGGTIYLLGGPGAISDAVERDLVERGYVVTRLAGPSRVETAIAVADVVRAAGGDRDEVLLARSEGTDDNPGSGWADSVTAGGVGAAAGIPVLVTPTDRLHPAVAAWLATDDPSSTILLGGTVALSTDVEAAVPRGRRVRGPDRAATAAAIATELWGVGATGVRRFTIVNGARDDGWAFGLAAAGIAADEHAPILLFTTALSAATSDLVSTCGDPQVDLAIVGDGSVVPARIREQLDDHDGRACAADGGLVLSQRLQADGECPGVLAGFQAEAVERVGPYGFETYYGFRGEPMPIAEPTPAPAAGEESAEGDAGAAPPTASEDSAAVGGGAGSGTNVQEAGVDEPDVLKTTSGRAVAIAQGRLQVVDLTGASPTVVGSMALPEGYGHELFLDGNRVLLLTRQGGGYFIVDPIVEPGPRPVEDGAASEPDAGSGGTTRAQESDEPVTSDPAMSPPPGEFAEPATRIDMIDLADPANPAIISTLTVDGDYRSARLVDGTARIVVEAQPQMLPFTYPSEGTAEAEASAAEANRQVVRDTTLDTWVPSYTLSQGGSTSGDLLVPCESISRPEGFSGFGTLAVFALDLDAGLQPTSSAGVVAEGQTVYASTDRLVIGTTRWWGGELVLSSDVVTTELHSFDISDPATTSYVGSGVVPGTLLSSFSLSQYAGHLRVATTLDPPWDAVDAVSSSAVTVLREVGGELVPVGAVGGLGLGERIYAVRFLGDIAALVTFRQIDPLYLLDLSDPTAPRVTGELKIPGYSAYLHRIDEDTLIGVGQDADDEGFVLGLKVATFDISDRSAPRQVDQVTYPQGSSEVEYDHKAFLYWAPTGLAVVPMSQWDEQTGEPEFLGALGLSVGADGALAEVGRLQHAAPSSEETYLAAIRRVHVVGSSLVSYSEGGLATDDLATLARQGFARFSAS